MRYHCHFEIDYLLGRTDRQLAEIISKPTDPQQARRELAQLQSEGHAYLVAGDCDNRTPDGRCAGHSTKDDEGEAA